METLVSQLSLSRYHPPLTKDNMYGYLLGHQAGLKLEELVKMFSKNFKSHRRVAESDLVILLFL